MANVETKSGYLVIERIGGLDVFMDDCFVCELCGKTLYDYEDEDEIIDIEALEADIEDGLDTLEVIDRISDPYNFI